MRNKCAQRNWSGNLLPSFSFWTNKYFDFLLYTLIRIYWDSIRYVKPNLNLNYPEIMAFEMTLCYGLNVSLSIHYSRYAIRYARRGSQMSDSDRERRNLRRRGNPLQKWRKSVR